LFFFFSGEEMRGRKKGAAFRGSGAHGDCRRETPSS
jgi:hypothetical protein